MPEIPLPEELVKSLPTIKYEAEMVDKINKQGPTCPICLAEWQVVPENGTGSIMTLACGHYFHAKCAEDNFLMRSKCAVCRHDHRRRDE